MSQPLLVTGIVVELGPIWYRGDYTPEVSPRVESAKAFVAAGGIPEW